MRTRFSPLLGLFSEMDSATAAFAEASGLTCPEGCGACCENPGAHATADELMPLASELVARGEAEAVLARAEAAGQGRCIFYTSHGPGLGRCAEYALRPTTCRLFGFAAIRNKRGQPELATCKVHQAVTPDSVARAHALVAQGASVPLFLEYQQRVQETGTSATAELLPMNVAVRRALERALLHARLDEQDAAAPEPPNQAA